MRIIRKTKKNESGQSLIEFALILPILLMLVMGIVEFGWIIMAKVTVNNAAREVVRAYVVGAPSDMAIDRGVELIDHLTLNGVSKENYKNQIVITPDNPSIGDKITVTITGDIKPLIGLYVGPTSINTTAHMRMENLP